MRRWFPASQDAQGRRGGWALVALIAAIGCSGSDPTPGDAAVDRVADITPDMPVSPCPTDQMSCTGRCVDLSVDRANCGSCGRTCATGQVCVAGNCRTSCPTGQTACAGLCASTNSDSLNCGACGVTCATGQVCSMGVCGVQCAAPLTECSMSDGDAGTVRRCADTRVDRTNCGACGTRCAAGQVCEGGACVLSCAASETACGGRCVDTQTDRANCGACGMACPSGQVCSSGMCATSCATGQTDCSGSCRDLQSDRANCGACGTACAAGQICAAGTCQTSCPAGQTVCGDRCVTLATDNANCGACGMSCAAGLVCSAGACALRCASTLTECGTGADRACANLTNDRANCGMCGAACGAGQVCTGGRCVISCPTGQTACGSVCVSTSSDVANCGGCGMACSAGQVCTAGVCRTSCPAGQTVCGSVCVSLTTDPANCGMCGTACPTGQVCSEGTCRSGCSGTLTECVSGATRLCADTQTDRRNCGTCGTACGAGQSCAAGRCVTSCPTGQSECGGVCSTLDNDPAHCGACDVSCGAGERCASGRCVTSCPSSQTACSGACVTTATDVANCGGCGAACGTRANASAACASGACRYTCAPTFGDCNGMAADGCETNTNTSVTHCGGCGMGCAAPANATATCAAGACGFVCNANFADCNGVASDGCEVDLLANPSNCGRCGVACPARGNAAPTCASGMCSFACNTGFADCDGAPANGCEVTLATAVSHCGMCGNACPVRANSTPVCAASACGVSCTSGYGDCNSMAADGCEVDLRVTASNCGACGTVCPAFAVCNSGSCSTCIVTATGDLAIPTGSTPTTVSATLPAVATATPNRVASMSCRTTTAGAEHIYTFTVTAPTPLQIYTTGSSDVTVSIRRNCLDGASEVACDDDGGASLNSYIRSVFAAGTYYVVVDSNSTTTMAYTLNVAQWTAAATNATCATATPLVEGTPVTGQNPAGGGDRSTQCQSTVESGQLFYSVAVPAGRRVTLTLTQTSTTARTIALRVFDACPTAACVNSLSTTALTAQTLTFDNASASPRTYIVGVSATDMATLDATFTLSAAFSSLPYVWSPITAACDSMTGGTAVTFTGTSDDSYSAIAPLPFTLPYFGATASHFSVTTNGFMQLWTSMTGSPSTAYSNGAMTSAPNGTVAAFWDDLAFPSAESYGAVTREITDAAGHRFVVQWTNFADYSAATARLTWQVKLFDSGVIEMHYCSMTNSSTTSNRHLGDSATVGIRSIDGLSSLQIGTNTVGLTRPATGYRITTP